VANTPIGQFSGTAPAIAFDGTTYHMVFVANNSTRQLLHMTSPDGLNWPPQAELMGGQSAARDCAPALGYFDVVIGLGKSQKLLVAVYVSNNEEQNILWTSLEPGSAGGWSGPFDINESSNSGVTLSLTGTPPTPTLYFVAHNNTHSLLETTTANRWPPTFL
jgi:hypothetical protein